MIRRSLSFVMLALCLAFSAGAQERNTVARAGADTPFFVSAKAATKDGDIRWEAFADEGVRTLLKAQIVEREQRAARLGTDANSEACSHQIISFSHLRAPHRSLDDLRTHSRAIYRGRIAAVTPGFNLDTPVSLLSIDVGRAIRTSEGLPARERVYVMYPAADFRIGNTRFCNAGPHPSYIPAAGDEIVVFAYDPPVDSDRTFLHTDPDQLFFQSGGKLIIPAALAADAALKQASKLDHVERAAETPRRRTEVKQ